MRLNILKLLLKIQLAEQECQGRPHVLGLLKLHFLNAICARQVQIDNLAVRDEEFPRWRSVLPTHAARLAKVERARFSSGALAGSAVGFGKPDFECLRPVITAFHLLQKMFSTGIGGERGHYGCQYKRESH